jgi:glycine/D-amino acid oxidase-like deaminating enzyme
VLENMLIQEVKTEEGFHTASADADQGKNNCICYPHPPGGINVLHFRNAPYRSYVIAATLTDDIYPEGLVHDMQEPYHYFRTHLIDGLQYLIAGGHDHKTGHGASEGIYAATGFNGNGMVLGTVSAMVLSDLILQGESEYKNLYDPAH